MCTKGDFKLKTKMVFNAKTDEICVKGTHAHVLPGEWWHIRRGVLHRLQPRGAVKLRYFGIKNDDLCNENDEFCIKNDECCIKMMNRRRKPDRQ